MNADTEYESDDNTNVLSSVLNANSKVTAYDLIARNCGGTASSLKQFAKIRRLKSRCTTYKNIKLYVQNSQGTSNVTVKNVYKINRTNERPNFGYKVYRMMLWHGTSPAAIPGILQTGFRMGSGGLYGGGIYFADRIAKSLGYCGKNSSNLGYFILAEIDLGKMYKSHFTHSNYSTPPSGFDSVKGMGSQIPKWKENKKYHGAILPCGPTVANTRHPSFQLPLNEYIVYDPSKLIVRFVVECQW